MTLQKPEKAHSEVWSEDKMWIVLIEASPHWADFKLVKVYGYEGGKPLFESSDCSYNAIDPSEASPVVTGFVKWDGCTEGKIGEEGTCGHHMCDASASVLELGKRWAWAINQCHTAMIAAGASAEHKVDLLWEPVPL